MDSGRWTENRWSMDHRSPSTLLRNIQMAAKAKVVLTDYVWESLDVEKKILAGLGELVPITGVS